MALPPKHQKHSDLRGSYVTLTKDGKPVWEPGLKAEITSRRQPQRKRKSDETDDEPIVSDIKVVLRMSPQERVDWVEKALAAMPRGKVKGQDVFDIITHRKIVSGVPDEVGQQMLQMVKESIVFFSEKQQHMIVKCRLVKEFKSGDRHKRRRRDDGESSKSSDEETVIRRKLHTDTSIRFQERRGSEVYEARASAEGSKDQPPPPPPPPNDISPEEKTRLEREYAEVEMERQRKKQEDLRKIDIERKAHEERERQRKAKIGNVFLMGGEEDESEMPQTSLRPMVEKRAEDRLRILDGESKVAQALGFSAVGGASSSTATPAQNSSAIVTMGGDNIVNEAQQILQKGAGVYLAQQEKRKKRSRSRHSRSRRRRSRTRSRSRSRSRRNRRGPPVQGADRRVRVFDSLRSPTPDGHLRGQMRAARKAKLMKQMLQQGNVPRVA